VAESAGTRAHDRGLVAVLLVVLVLVGAALVLDAGESAAAGPAPARAEIDLKQRLQDVQLRREGDALVVVGKDGAATSGARWLEDLAAAQETQRGAGFLYVLFNISRPAGFLWVAIGFLGQAAFTFRMLLQWWASEKAGRSVIPIAFWYGSLAGGALLLVYFIWRKDVVGVIGQSTGVFVYARNIALVRRGALPGG
jgi:lipid-A-disaccharide synthase-like uncharacterized protein